MIGRIASGIWHFFDGVRKFLHLLMLLVIFGIVVGALRTSIPHIADNSALVIAPQGDIVEQLSGSPVDQALDRAQGNGPGETLLWDLKDALHAAKKDAHQGGGARSEFDDRRRAADSRRVRVRH